MKPWHRIVFGCLSLFILITVGFKLHVLDMPVARFVRSFDVPGITRGGDLLAILGQGGVLGTAFALLWVIGHWRKKAVWKDIGFSGLVALVCETLVVQVLKHTIGRPRPRFAHGDDFIVGPSLSSGLDAFPSGHSINSFGAAAVLAWFIPSMRVAVFILAGLVAISRVLRGSHFPTDVFTGALLGIIIGGLIAAGPRRWYRKVLPQFIRIGVPTIVFLFLLIWVLLHPVISVAAGKWHLAAGASIILLGMLMRVAAIFLQTVGTTLSYAGSALLLLGVGAATGPWWIAILLLLSLLPVFVAGIHEDATSHPVAGANDGRSFIWLREGFALSMAILGIAVMRSVSGLIPLVIDIR